MKEADNTFKLSSASFCNFLDSSTIEFIIFSCSSSSVRAAASFSIFSFSAAAISCCAATNLSSRVWCICNHQILISNSSSIQTYLLCNAITCFVKLFNQVRLNNITKRIKFCKNNETVTEGAKSFHVLVQNSTRLANFHKKKSLPALKNKHATVTCEARLQHHTLQIL